MFMKSNYLNALLAFVMFSIGVNNLARAQENVVSTKQQLLDKIRNKEIPPSDLADSYRLLGSYYMGEFNDSATYFYNKGLNLSRLKNDSINIIKFYNRLAITAYSNENDDQSIKYADSALSFANQNNKEHFPSIAYSYKIQADAYTYKERMDVTLEKLLLANRFLSKDEQTNEIKKYVAENYNDLAQVYFEATNFEKALACSQQSLLIAKSVDALAELGDAYAFQANYFYDQKEYLVAEKFIDSAVTIFKKMEFDAAINYLKKTKSQILLDENKFNEAISILKEVANDEKAEAIDYVNLENYLYLSDAFTQKGTILSARKYLDSAKILLEHTINPIHSINIQRQTAEILKKENNIPQAIATYQQILQNPALRDYVETEKDVLKELYELNEGYNNPANAYMYFKEYTILKDSLTEVLQQNKLNVLQTEFNYNEVVSKLETRDAQLKFSKEEQKRIKQRDYFIIVALSLLGLFALLSFIRQKTLSKVKRDALQSKQEILSVKKDALDKEMAYKNKQITDFAIHIQEKNDLLETIKTKLKGIKVINDSHKGTVMDAIHFINNDIENNKEKIQLYQEVEQTSDSFRAKINDTYPDLNDKEIKVATMLRLGQTSKQIALQLGISAASVDNYRYNLRKKMNLPKGESLKKFIQAV